MREPGRVWRVVSVVAVGNVIEREVALDRWHLAWDDADHAQREEQCRHAADLFVDDGVERARERDRAAEEEEPAEESDLFASVPPSPALSATAEPSDDLPNTPASPTTSRMNGTKNRKRRRARALPSSVPPACLSRS